MPHSVAIFFCSFPKSPQTHNFYDSAKVTQTDGENPIAIPLFIVYR